MTGKNIKYTAIENDKDSVANSTSTLYFLARMTVVLGIGRETIRIVIFIISAGVDKAVPIVYAAKGAKINRKTMTTNISLLNLNP